MISGYREATAPLSYKDPQRTYFHNNNSHQPDMAHHPHYS